MNPGMPQPYAAPPAAPPQKSGGALKWILIGCGCVLLLVLAAIGSCVAFGVWAVNKGMQTVKAWQDLGDTRIKGNAVVEKQIGKVASVQLAARRNERRQTQGRIFVPFIVTGEKGEAVVELEIEIKSISDLTTPHYISGHLYGDGKKINIDTGTETEYKGPKPDVTPITEQTPEE